MRAAAVLGRVMPLAIVCSCAGPVDVRGGPLLAPPEGRGLIVVSAYSDTDPVELVLASADSMLVRKYVLEVPARELTVRVLTAPAGRYRWTKVQEHGGWWAASLGDIPTARGGEFAVETGRTTVARTVHVVTERRSWWRELVRVWCRNESSRVLEELARRSEGALTLLPLTNGEPSPDPFLQLFVREKVGPAPVGAGATP